jgi:hypothetical protein
MDMIEAAFDAYLSGDSDKEIAFLEDCMGIPLPKQKPAKSGGTWFTSAEHAISKSGGRDSGKEAKRFRSCYTALKGMFLFWIDYKLFEAAQGSENPNMYRGHLNALTRRHCIGDERETDLFGEIHRRYEDFSGAYIEHSASGGGGEEEEEEEEDDDVGFEAAAFRGALAPYQAAPGTEEYLLSCKTAIFGWLGMLRGSPAPRGPSRPKI